MEAEASAGLAEEAEKVWYETQGESKFQRAAWRFL